MLPVCSQYTLCLNNLFHQGSSNLVDLTPRTAVLFVFSHVSCVPSVLRHYKEVCLQHWSLKGRIKPIEKIDRPCLLLYFFFWATLHFQRSSIFISSNRVMQQNWHNDKQSPFCWQLMNCSFYWMWGVDESMRLYPHVACSIFNIVFTIKDCH